MAKFICMLTHKDTTVPNALEAYADIAETGLAYVGFKDIGLPFSDLLRLTEEIHRHGQKVMLEVVSTTRDAESSSIRAGIELGVDYLLGGRHADDAVRLLQGTGIQYFPFCGNTMGHPTTLTGSIQEIVDDARRLAAMPGVHGLDLLAYRFNGDVEELAQRVMEAVDVPVIAAGSIDRLERIAAMQRAGAWGFTVGSALFDHCFVSCSPGQEHPLRRQVRSLLQVAESHDAE